VNGHSSPAAPCRHGPPAGSIDVAETLRTGTPRYDRGLLAEADGGVMLLTSAERLTPTRPHFLPPRWMRAKAPAQRFAILALDEGIDDERRTRPSSRSAWPS
jgi:hypothetical protein